MVTFRFYVVSLAAFFLSLAVGVVIGSALDERIVDSLRDRMNDVETNLDRTVSTIEQKNEHITDLEAYIDQAAPHLIAGRLEGTTVLVVAEDGVGEASAADLVVSLRQAGAHVDGVAWLDPRWDLADLADRERLSARFPADDRSTETGDSGDVSNAAVRQRVWEATLGELLAAPTDAPITTFGLLALSSLAEEGFLRMQAIEGADGPGGPTPLVVVITAPGGAGEGKGSATSSEAAGEADRARVPMVVAEAAPTSIERDARASTLAELRNDQPAKVSTVDDLEQVAGRVATVLALVDLQRDRRGDYGYGPDVDGVVPPWLGD